MGVDDLISSESAFVAAATATVFSPKTRETIRRGAVYTVAGALMVGDVVAGAARGVSRGLRGQAQKQGANANAGTRTPARTASGGTRSKRSTSASRGSRGNPAKSSTP